MFAEKLNQPVPGTYIHLWIFGIARFSVFFNFQRRQIQEIKDARYYSSIHFQAFYPFHHAVSALPFRSHIQKAKFQSLS